MVTSVSEDKLKVYKIGEDFTLSASGEDKDGNNIVNDKISAHVDSVQTADDLKLLNGADLPEEWENVINSNGKLVKNKVSYIKSGDGVNSVDRVIKTENVITTISIIFPHTAVGHFCSMRHTVPTHTVISVTGLFHCIMEMVVITFRL